jgi:hypothetical protein
MYKNSTNHPYLRWRSAARTDGFIPMSDNPEYGVNLLYL